MLYSSIDMTTTVTALALGLLALKGVWYAMKGLPRTRTPEGHFQAHIIPELALDGDIPDDTSDFFTTNGLCSYACSKASGNMNFDFFETKQSTNGLVSFYLGDVSGKGLPASLCQAACTSLLRLAATISTDPVGIVSEVNESLSHRGIEGRFVTLIYGTLELSSGRLRLLSAGHPNPVRISRNDKVEFLECTPCLPLGVIPEHKYVLTEYRLEPGDTLLLYSDGIVEARDSKRDFFGERRLAEIAKQFHSSFPQSVVNNVFEDVQSFSDARKDDQTLLALHYSGLRSEFATNPLQPALSSVS